MSKNRPFAAVQSDDQWRRSAHTGTSLLEGIVQLSAIEKSRDEVNDDVSFPSPAGLAFDPWCRLYHSRPAEGQVDRLVWRASGVDPLVPPAAVFSETVHEPHGDFSPAEGPVPALHQPQSLAIDHRGRLFVSESGKSRVLIFDLVEQRLIRVVEFAGQPQILDLVSTGESIFVLLDRSPFLMLFDAGRGPRSLDAELHQRGLRFEDFGLPSRLAFKPVADGEFDECTGGGEVTVDRLYLLCDAGTADAKVIPLAAPDDVIELRFATDLEFRGSCGAMELGNELVVAREPGSEFARYCLEGSNVSRLGNLRARGYDGRGIVRTPNESIGYWSARGFRHAVASQPRYMSRGQVTTFRLDSGQFQMQWGRVFLDACLPADTQIRLHCVASDETPRKSLLPRTLPENIENVELTRPDLSPPMPPSEWVSDIEEWQPLHQRETGRELPWTRREDRFETYEAPVNAGPGRYLWITLELSGNTRRTPRIRSLRVEYPSHDLMMRLPRLYSRNAQAADFLRRYLAMFEGTLGTLDTRAQARHALIDPASAPAETLPWLASMVGMTLDRRWSEAARRTFIAEAITLFRFRGTIRGLRRMLAIYLGFEIGIVESYRFRGLGGARLGSEGDPRTAAIVGSFRVGGRYDAGGNAVSELEDEVGEDSFERHAHRFSVVVPASLSQEQLDVVRLILDRHRPAHTLYEICTVDSGLRIGNGAHLELTTVLGHGGEFGTLQTGGSVIGRSDVVGYPRAGTRAGSSHLGKDTVIGSAERTFVADTADSPVDDQKFDQCGDG